MSRQDSKGQEYSAIFRIYDRWNAELDYGAWADFIEACFARYLPQRPQIVLDLACGTGSMTLSLAARGYDMIGVDASADMLSVAYERSAACGVTGVLFLQQDMRTFELYGTVGAVSCCLDSVNYLLCEQDLLRCFNSVHTYLEPDGLFLFDVNTPYKFETVYGDCAYVQDDAMESEEGQSVSTYCGWQNHYDATTGICTFDLTLFEQMEDGSYRRFDEQQKERCYTKDALRRCLEQAGFEWLGLYGDYSFGAPTDTSERWYIVARCKKET